MNFTFAHFIVVSNFVFFIVPSALTISIPIVVFIYFFLFQNALSLFGNIQLTNIFYIDIEVICSSSTDTNTDLPSQQSFETTISAGGQLSPETASTYQWVRRLQHCSSPHFRCIQIKQIQASLKFFEVK